MATAIEATDLRKHYPPNVQALDGITLAVDPGTIFGARAKRRW
jgi:ABC-type multidrug transport system ATPase subunit